jgi:F420-non-reducing hydrogenase iron-sulfur subunit
MRSTPAARPAGTRARPAGTRARPAGTRAPARITALLCENSAYKAYLDIAEEPEFEGVDVVRLPCSGKAETGLVLRMLEAGSRGVLVVGCPKENCEYVRGSDRAGRRVSAARAALADAGVSPERVRMEYVSSVESHRLLAVLRDFAASLEDEEATS